MTDKNSIKEYFRGKNIFITGGSGFIGKALIEKLLRSCHDVGKIYVLLRSKKGKALYERLEVILTSPLFEVLKNSNPESFKKIVPINGDINALGLDISEIDRKTLQDEVHIVFNCAASVKFDDLIKDSIISNLRSTREVALLALEMKNIEAVLHVSTAYCNVDIKERNIQEVLYPAPQSWSEAIELAEKYDPDILAIMTPKYIGNFPNTYTFTKRLAEHCINDLLVGKIPTIICRPSVVIGAIEEPIEGWTDNFNGPIGILVAGGTGLVRSAYANPEANIDYIPVDNTVKSMLISVWQKAKYKDAQQLSIFHLCKSDLLSYKMKDLMETTESLIWDVPFEKKIWYPRCSLASCFYEYYLKVIFYHVLPALFIDLLFRLAGRKPIIFKTQIKIYQANTALSFFMFNDWNFDKTNNWTLLNALSKRERKEFNCLVLPTSQMSIKDYIYKCGGHCRIYLLNESKDITEANRRRTRRMYYLDLAFKTVFYITAAWLFIIHINVPGKLWIATYNYWSTL